MTKPSDIPTNPPVVVFADRVRWSDQVEIFLGTHLVNGKKWYVKTMLFEDWPEATMMQPAFTMQSSDAQILMDNLWSLGIRPSRTESSADKASALQSHLDDMRAIVFDKLKVSRP